MEEKLYLEKVKTHILQQIEMLNKRIYEQKAKRKEQMKYIWQNIHDIDKAELIYWDNTVLANDIISQRSLQEIIQLKRTLKSPYFGKIVVVFNNEPKGTSFYIGVKGIQDRETHEIYTIDWRSPIASLFYENDIGKARYLSPSGATEVFLQEKKQLVIKNGDLDSIFDTSDPIHDGMLLSYLEQNSTQQMKTIVTTLQKEQNQVIRRTKKSSLFLLGPAGSGKTSIALHRAAYLLYKDQTIKASQIVFISPKDYLHEYISSVLPSLNESEITIKTYHDFAIGKLKKHLDDTVQLTDNLGEPDIQKQKALLVDLEEFCAWQEKECLHFPDIIFDKLIIPKEELEHIFYTKFKRIPVFARLPYLKREIKQNYARLFRPSEKRLFYQAIRNSLQVLFDKCDLLRVYRKFIQWLDNVKNIRWEGGAENINCSIALLLLKMLFGISSDKAIQYLVVDEMQDLSLLQHKALSISFSCPFMVVGDLNQSQLYSSDDLKNIQDFYGKKHELFQLTNCYRSTYEIVLFSKKIIKDVYINPIERHGDQVLWFLFSDRAAMDKYLADLLQQELALNRWNNIGIIVPNETDRILLMAYIEGKGNIKISGNSPDKAEKSIRILDIKSVKGLEYDCVFVYQTNASLYQSFRGTNLLYTAVTRALHKLVLLSDSTAEKDKAMKLLPDTTIEIR